MVRKIPFNKKRLLSRSFPLFFETVWHGENPYLHVLDVLSWILAVFFIGRMKEGWYRRTRELEHANAELHKQMRER
ncbi:MAG: hypothetical protein E4H46_02010 [Desulfobacterales bacterium]|nr:MAG: hypothetical protein E4H46_02010 [Desulfobacterales bacterium]